MFNIVEIFQIAICSFCELLITTLKYIRKHENYLYKKTQ